MKISQSTLFILRYTMHTFQCHFSLPNSWLLDISKNSEMILFMFSCFPAILLTQDVILQKKLVPFGQNDVSWLCLKGARTQSGKGTGGWRGKAGNCEYFPGPGEPHLQQGTRLSPVLGWMRSLGQKPLCPFSTPSLMCVLPWPPSGVPWKRNPHEANFESSCSLGSLAGHWSRWCQNRGILCPRDSHTGTTKYLVRNGLPGMWVVGLGETGKEGGIIRTEASAIG